MLSSINHFLLQATFLLFFTIAFCQDDHPAYSESDLPVTRFSCRNKQVGGYYADIETRCQMYHVCHKDKDNLMKSTKFLCGNGTVFDQRHLVCQDFRKVGRRCRQSRKYYRRNLADHLEHLENRRRTKEGEKRIRDAQRFDPERLWK